MALGGRWSYGTAGMCGVERRGARAADSDRRRPQPAAQARRAGAHRARLRGSALGAAGGAEPRRQPADRVAMATALRRERVDGLLRDKTRRPGKTPIAAAIKARMVALTCTEPPHEATH
jgi:hypothetical protein